MLTLSAERWLSDASLTKRCYVPFVARTPWLLTILIALLACIGVLEDGLRSGKRGDSDSGNSLKSRAWKRQETNATSRTLATASTTSQYSEAGPQLTASTDYLTLSTTSTEQVFSTAAQSTYITLSTASEEPTLTAAKSTYITISTSPTTKDKGPNYQ